jgi:hypothetical protein
MSNVVDLVVRKMTEIPLHEYIDSLFQNLLQYGNNDRFELFLLALSFFFSNSFVELVCVYQLVVQDKVRIKEV